jgi:hypothetical protein
MRAFVKLLSDGTFRKARWCEDERAREKCFVSMTEKKYRVDSAHHQSESKQIITHQVKCVMSQQQQLMLFKNA